MAFRPLSSKSRNVEMQLFFDFESFFGQSKLDIFFVLFSLAEKTFENGKRVTENLHQIK